MEYSRPRGCSCPRPMKGGHRPSCFLTSTPKPPRPAVSMNTETRSIGTFIESPLPSRRQQYVQTVQVYKDDDFKPLERRPKPSNGNEPLKWRPELSNSDETTQKHPLLNTRTYPTNMRPESINNVEPVKRSPEPSNSNKPLKWHPTISHSDETTKKRPMLGISTYPTKMRPESSIEPVERRPEPSNNNESLKWHPAISNSDETTKKRPMFGISTYTTKMRPESSIEPVERSPKPSNNDELLKWHPAISNSDETTKKRPVLGISTYPTKMRPEPSIEPVERRPEPSNNDEPLKWHPAISNSDETTKKRPVLGISTYPTKMRPEPSIDPVERRPELSNSNERLKGRSELSNSDKRKTRRPLLSNRTYTSKTHPKTSNSNEYLKRHPLLFRNSRESLKSVNGEERKKSSRDAIGSRESEGSRGPAQECRSCLRWSACVRKQSSSDQQIASPRRKSEPESSIFEPRKKSSQKDEPCTEGSVSVKSQEFPDASLRNGQTHSKESKSREIEPVIFPETYLAGKTNNILVEEENARQNLMALESSHETPPTERQLRMWVEEENTGENVIALESSRETPPMKRQLRMWVEEENTGENVLALESSRETPPTERQIQMWVEDENKGENLMALESSREIPPPEKQINMLAEEENKGENVMALESSRETLPTERQLQMWVEEENTGENVMALESLRETPSPGKNLKILKEKKTARKGGVYASSKVIGSPLKAQSTKPVEKRPSPLHPVLRASRRCVGLNRPQTPAKEFLERKKLQLGYKRKIHPSMSHKDVPTHGGTFPVSKTLAPVVNLPRHRTFILPTPQRHQQSRSPCTVLQIPPSYTSTRRPEPPCYCFEAARLSNLSPRNHGPLENLCYCNVPDYVIRPCQSCCSETRDIVIHPPTCGNCRCPAPSNFVLAVCSQPRRYQHMLGRSLLQSLTRPVYRGDVFQEHQVFYHDTQELNSTLELSTGNFESKKNTCTGSFPLYKNVSNEFKEKAPNQKSMESGDTNRVIKVESRQPYHVTDYRLYSTESAKSPVLEFGKPYYSLSRENKSTISCEAALSLGKPLVRVLPWHLSTGDARRGVEEARMTGEATAVHSTTQYVQPWLLRIEKETLEVTFTPQKIDQCLVNSDEDEQRYTCVPNVSQIADPQDGQNTTMSDREDKYRNDIQHNTLTESSKEWQLPLQQNNFGEIFNHPTNHFKIMLTRSNTTDDDTGLNNSSQNKSPLIEKLFRESIASDERVRAAPVEHPSKECECDCHPFLPGQVSDMCTCKCDACISIGTPIHRFNEVYEDWNNDPCTSTHVQRDVHMSWDDPQRPKEEMTEKPHARFLAIPPAQLNIGSVSNNATQVPSLHNMSTQTETLESVSCRKNPIWGGSRVQPVEIARLQRVRQERVLWEEPKRVQWEEPTRVQQVEVMRLQRVREERVPWEEPKRAQWVAPEDSHAAASTTCITTQHFRLVPPLTGPLFTAQKESPTKLRPVTRIYRVDLDGDDESKEDVERSPNHIKNPNEKRRSLISTSSESSVVTCHRGKVKKDLWLIFKALEGVLAIVCLALSVHVYQNLLRPVDQKSSSYQARLPYSGRLEDMDYDNSTTFAPDSTDTRDQEGLPTLMFAAFWAVCACIILILVASVAAICWGKRFCNLILIVLAILGVVAFLVFGILFVLTYKDRYPKRAVKLLMVICFILAAVFLVDLIYCICIRGKRRT